MVTKTIKKGYKPTELGVIPEDWDVKKIGDIGEVKMCRRVFNHETKELGEIPFYKIGTFGNEADAYISQDLYNDYRHKFSFPKKGDILISAAGTIGRTIVYNGEPAYFQDSNIVWINNDERLISNSYLYYVYQVVKYNTEGGTIQRLYNSILTSARFICPIRPEQIAIATVLSDTDTFIDHLDKLITKKKDIKQGTMQQLLTGQKRLPGFSGKWEENTIQALEKVGVITLSRGRVISKIDIAKNPGDYPIYSSSVHNNGKFGQYGEFMFDEELITWSVDGGGHFFYRPKHKFSVTNVCGFMRVYTKKIDYKFIALQLQLLHSRLFFDYTMKAHPSIIRKAYNLMLPTLGEQTAISTVLSDMETEIEMLKQKRDKYAMLKNGMMQQLLTGNIRIYATK